MKRVAIIGFGVSGKAAYSLLKEKCDCEVFVFDDQCYEAGIEENWYCGDDVKAFYKLRPDMVVVSPGIPRANPLVAYAVEAGWEVISEVELAFTYTNTPVVGVTGTNGKTTTVAIIEEIMKRGGMKTVLCGNCGFAMSSAVLSDDRYDYMVVELSSYQLEFIESFRPKVAVLLNISPDHIKWHGSFQDYMRAKLRIFENQTVSDWAVINDSLLGYYTGKATPLVFSSTSKESDCYVESSSVVVNVAGGGIIRPKYLMGLHNMENVGAAALVSMLCGVEWGVIKEVCEEMETLEHRIEFVGELDGVKFYNDSKSTNLNSVVSALNVFENGRVVLILGGKHKGESFSSVLGLLQKKTKGIVVYGEDRKIYLEDLKKMVPIPLPALNIWGAIRAAFEIAREGDVVLFSPGGSSCEPFKNYEERGEAFKREFLVLKDEYERAPKF